MTGSTIFYSVDYRSISSYVRFDNDLYSKNYNEFLSSVSSALVVLGYDLTNVLTNNSCSVPIPQDLSFYISKEVNIQQSIDDNLHVYKISASVASTVMNAETYLQYPIAIGNDSNNTFFIPLQIASLKTNIVDQNFQKTTLITFWDGNITYFVDDNDANSTMFATANIEYMYDSNASIPSGYTAKYDVYVELNSKRYDGFIQVDAIYNNGKPII
eukprot:291433_1